MDWQRAYQRHETPWDLRQVTPPLLRLIAGRRLAELGVERGGVVAVVGCGRGHDVRAWARAGFRVTGFDIVPDAVDEARQLLRWNRVHGAEVLCRDVLGIGGEFPAAFDLVYDYTCFCAVPPHLRQAYGREVGAIVRPGGIWLGLAYPTDPERTGSDGSPYLIRPEDLAASLGHGFELVDEFEPEDSVLRRRGAERWFAWRRR